MHLVREGEEAVASLIITEAGGRISDFRGGDEAIWSANAVAYNGHLHELLLAAARRHLTDLTRAG